MLFFYASNDNKLNDSLVQNLSLSKYSNEEEKKSRDANVIKEDEQEQPFNTNLREEIQPQEEEVALNEN